MQSLLSTFVFLSTTSINTAIGAYFSQFSLQEPDHDSCYDSAGWPTRCIPDFINAAFGKPVIASNTCGQTGPSR